MFQTLTLHHRTSHQDDSLDADVTGHGSKRFVLVVLWLAHIAIASVARAEPEAPVPQVGSASKFAGHQGSVLGLAFSADGPDCPRALDVVAGYRSLGTIARGAEEFSFALDATADPSLYRRLLTIDNLPAETRERLVDATTEQGADLAVKLSQRGEVARSLLEAGAKDGGEPGWDVLGGLLREVEFLAAYRQLAYEQALAVPSDDTSRLLAPLVADHPYALFIASHISDRAKRNETLRSLAERIDAADLQMTEAPMFDKLLNVDRLARARLSSAALAHNDDVFRDLVVTCQRYPAAYREHFVKRLRRIAPHQPATAWLSIQEDWQFAREQAAECQGGALSSAGRRLVRLVSPHRAGRPSGGRDARARANREVEGAKSRDTRWANRCVPLADGPAPRGAGGVGTGLCL